MCPPVRQGRQPLFSVLVDHRMYRDEARGLGSDLATVPIWNIKGVFPLSSFGF